MASFDFLHFTNPVSWETKNLDYIKSKFYAAYERGNVLTFCWHYYNPVTGNNFYDTTQVVKHILPGGSRHETFKSDLKIIADFAHNAKNHVGELMVLVGKEPLYSRRVQRTLSFYCHLFKGFSAST